MATYIRAAADTVVSTIDTAMKRAGNIRKDPDATEQAIRFVGCSALAASAISGVSTPLLSNLSGRLLENADLINCFQLVPNVHDIASGDYSNPERSILEKLANATFTSVALGSVSLMLDSWKFIDLTKIAATIGNKVSLLKPITQLGAGVIIRSQLAFAFACSDIYNIKKLVECQSNDECEDEYEKKKNKLQKRQLMIDVAQLTSQVAVNTLIVTGAVATSPAVIALGLTAFGLGVTSFVYKISCKEKLKDLKEKLEASKEKSDEKTAIDESGIEPFQSFGKSGYMHWVDFAKRVSTSFEGVDYTCKFGVGSIALFGLFAPVTAPFAAASKTFSAMVDLGKLTALATRVHSLRGDIVKGKYSFKKTVSDVCLATVSVFESLSWIWGMKDLEKSGNVFKTWRNGFFITGLTAGVTKDSHDIESQDDKIKEAEAGRLKWEKRKADCAQSLKSAADVKDYYQGKIDSATSATTKGKVEKWEGVIKEINELKEDEKEGYRSKFTAHLAKKQGDWEGIKEYREAQKEFMLDRRIGASTKIFSLVVDLSVISMTVCAVSSMIIPVIGIQFAALARAKQIFVVANFALGCINLNNFYTNEYNVKDRFTYLTENRNIKSDKLKND